VGTAHGVFGGEVSGAEPRGSPKCSHVPARPRRGDPGALDFREPSRAGVATSLPGAILALFALNGIAFGGRDDANRSVGGAGKGGARRDATTMFRLTRFTGRRCALYPDIFAELEPDRALYLAVSNTTFDDIFEEGMGQLLLANGRLKLLVFNTDNEVIQRWTPEPPTGK
jgi:hypothetical protein